MSKLKFELGEDEILQIVEILPKDGIIILKGDLASGKTTLVRAIARNCSVKEIVNSPTFSVMQNYGEIYHYDIYNSGFSGILENGLFENFFESGLHLIEWGDENLQKMLENFGLKFCIVEISVGKNGEKRVYEVENV